MKEGEGMKEGRNARKEGMQGRNVRKERARKERTGRKKQLPVRVPSLPR